MKSQNTKGFTLIELLVVIAIIGILSSVVLASLNSARSKGAEASIKANLANIRPQAEMYYDSNSFSYGTHAAGTCNGTTGTGVFSDASIRSMLASAIAQSPATNATCAAGASAYAVSVQLPGTPTAHWCVDSAGRAMSRSSAITTTACQ